MTMATARSTTLPRSRNFLNPLNSASCACFAPASLAVQPEPAGHAVSHAPIMRPGRAARYPQLRIAGRMVTPASPGALLTTARAPRSWLLADLAGRKRQGGLVLRRTAHAQRSRAARAREASQTVFIH